MYFLSLISKKPRFRLLLYTVLINGLYIEDVFPPNYREDTAPLPLQLYEKVSFHATLQDIKEFLNAANFQLKLESEEFCNFYDTLHSHAAELYLEAQQKGQLLFPKSENTKPAPSYSTSEVTPSTFSLATTLHLNEDGIPHSEHSPAMPLKDGTEIWRKKVILIERIALPLNYQMKMALNIGTMIFQPSAWKKGQKICWLRNGKLHRENRNNLWRK